MEQKMSYIVKDFAQVLQSFLKKKVVFEKETNLYWYVKLSELGKVSLSN